MDESSCKACSICGLTFPLLEFNYGKRDGRSYCKACNKAWVYTVLGAKNLALAAYSTLQALVPFRSAPNPSESHRLSRRPVGLSQTGAA